MNKCVFSGGLCCMFDGPCCNTQPIFYYFVWAIKILQILIPVILLIIGIIKLKK